MKGFLNLSLFICLIWAGQRQDQDQARFVKTQVTTSDTVPKARMYSGLIFKGSQTLSSSWGLKSVLLNANGTKVYALNLEGMSIFEFDRESKKISREIKFLPTRATGLDYNSKKTIPSFAEKPVEACFSHNDKILWVSLHNAGGIVPLILDSTWQSYLHGRKSRFKTACIMNMEAQLRDTVTLPLVQTGKTPKVIAKTRDNRYLMVSNWSSKTLTVLMTNDSVAPYAKKIATIGLPGTPRGIAVDDKNQKTYVAIMGGNAIAVINHRNWGLEKNIKVARNPRHVLVDSRGNLFVSFNATAEIACIEPRSGRLLFKTYTHAQPRTIAFSENQKYLFVTCYSGNSIDVFKVNKRSFNKVFTFKCTGKPVGIDLYEDENILEAWVGNYMTGNLCVYTFQKAYN